MGERRYIGVESELNFAGCIVLGVVKMLAFRLRVWRITRDALFWVVWYTQIRLDAWFVYVVYVLRHRWF